MLSLVHIRDSHTLGPQIEMIQKKKFLILPSYICKKFEIPNLRNLGSQNNHPTISMI